MGWIRASLSGEGGFSLSEVLVAGLILAVALLPMAGMFDGAFLVARAASGINEATGCVSLFLEKVRNIPYYVAHSEEDQHIPMDVDDFFWGGRSPIYQNSWENAPRVVMKPKGSEPYPDLEVTVKMAYLDDSAPGASLEDKAEATAISIHWAPNALYGYDRPKTSDGKALNVILYEVEVTTSDGRSFRNAQLYASPTDVVANVYIDKMVNVSGAGKLGTRYDSAGDCYSAPHNVNSLTLRAYGEGFTAADVSAGLVDVKLVRVEDADLPFTGMSYGEEVDGRKYIQGTVNISGGGDEPPWGPAYRMPGYWHAWLVVNHVISVRNNAFVMEYPVPVYHEATSSFTDSSGDRSGEESSDDEVITFTNLDYVIDLISYASKEEPGVGAVVQLIHTIPEVANDPSGKGVITGTYPTINPQAQKGYQTGLTLTAHFDFRGKVGGNYKVRVVNCISRAGYSIDIMGNTYFDLDGGPYYFLQGPPDVREAYVYEETPASPERRHFVYDDRSYAYTLEIKGYNFDEFISISDIKLGLGGDTSTDPPSGADNEISPSDLTYIDTETLRATFNLAPEVEESERGIYWLWVRNSNGYGGVLSNAIDIRRPAPIIYSYDFLSYGPWQNYYGVEVSMVGECFDVDALGPTYVDAMIKEESHPENDWLATEAMEDPVAADAGRLLNCKLNLVGCDVGRWEIYVKSQPAGLTDSGYTDIRSGYVYRAYLDVSVGQPVLLTDAVPLVDEPWSVSVRSRYRNWNPGIGDWKEWRPWDTSTEGGGTAAWAYENDENQASPKTLNCTQGEMYFTRLRGMGFNKGTIAIEAVNDFGENTAGMNAAWNGIAVYQNRAAPEVWIEMTDANARKTGPHIRTGGALNPIRLRIKNEVGGVWSPWFLDRIRVQIGSQY